MVGSDDHCHGLKLGGPEGAGSCHTRGGDICGPQQAWEGHCPWTHLAVAEGGRGLDRWIELDVKKILGGTVLYSPRQLSADS